MNKKMILGAGGRFGEVGVFRASAPQMNDFDIWASDRLSFHTSVV